MECEVVVRTGPGLVQWWALLTKTALNNRFDSWAAQFLIVLKGWVIIICRG